MSNDVEILHKAGEYEIRTPPGFLNYQLLNIEYLGRICYQSYRGTPITTDTAAAFVRMLIAKGHESVLEHGYITVRFDKHSRGFTHELVRHRLCAFSQESTRYVDYELEKHKARVVCPPSHDPFEALEDYSGMNFEDMADVSVFHYKSLRDAGWPPEDARQILPIGTKSEIGVSANFREWRHIFTMRCDRFAHWEIRRTMVKLLSELKPMLPGIFDDFVYGGKCKNGIDFYVRKMPFGKFKRQLTLLTDKELNEIKEKLRETEEGI